MPSQRARERTKVDIAVTITTVLHSLDAVVADLSPRGALVVGASLPQGTQLQVDLDGYSAFATVMWSEKDRMGLRFPFELSDGPLFEELEAALMRQRMPIMPIRNTQRASTVVTGAFGRRSL